MISAIVMDNDKRGRHFSPCGADA